jgi:hypothetical protein
MSSYLANLIDIVGCVASVTGLVVSFLDWRRAAEAKTAAREARDAVHRSNAAEDLQSVTMIAKDLLAAVEAGQLYVAGKCGRDLVSHLDQTKQRWTPTPEGKARLDKAAAKITQVSLVLAQRGQEIAPDGKARLLKFAHDVVVTLAEETGKMQLLIDKRTE